MHTHVRSDPASGLTVCTRSDKHVDINGPAGEVGCARAQIKAVEAFVRFVINVVRGLKGQEPLLGVSLPPSAHCVPRVQHHACFATHCATYAASLRRPSRQKLPLSCMYAAQSAMCGGAWDRAHVAWLTPVLLTWQDPFGYQGGVWNSFEDVMSIYGKHDVRHQVAAWQQGANRKLIKQLRPVLLQYAVCRVAVCNLVSQSGRPGVRLLCRTPRWSPPTSLLRRRLPPTMMTKRCVKSCVGWTRKRATRSSTARAFRWRPGKPRRRSSSLQTGRLCESRVRGTTA